MEIEPDESQDASVPSEPPADGPEPIETESPESQDTSMPDEPAADGPEPMETESPESPRHADAGRTLRQTALSP